LEQARRNVRWQRETNIVSGPENASIADAWIKYQYLSGRERETSALFDAWLRLNDLIRDEPETAWPIIQEMWSLDQSDFILANIAAGPVEDLLRIHGPGFIGELNSSRNATRCFGNCWARSGAREWLRACGKG